MQKSRFLSFMTPRQVTLFLVRLVLATIVVGAIPVFFQDYLINPAVISAGRTGEARDPGALPEGTTAQYITTSDGERIEVWHKRASEPGLRPRMVVLLFHGNGETVQVTYSLQHFFAELGVDSYTFDYRGYGRSSGFPSEAGLYRDVDAFLEHVQSQEGDQTRYVILGHSLGTGFAAYGARQLPGASVVLLAPYVSMRSVVSETAGVSWLTGFLRYEIPTLHFLKEAQPHCLFLLHGQQDYVIRSEQTMRLYEELRQNGQHRVQAAIDPLGNHVNLIQRNYRQILQFIDACFQGSALPIPQENGAKISEIDYVHLGVRRSKSQRD